MKTTILSFCFLAVAKMTSAQKPVITNPVSALGDYTTEIISSVKMAKEYYMNSTDTAAGQSFEQRTAKLSQKISALFAEFVDKRKIEYQATRFKFSGTQAVDGKEVTDRVIIATNTYTFYNITRTTNGDWKGGPYINKIDRSNWTGGDIPGGSVVWKTGGHHKASTTWTIDARYETNFITKTVAKELKEIKRQLHAQNLPSK